MSKKDKSKFKKQIKAQLLQEVSQASAQIQSIQSPQKAKEIAPENVAVGNGIVDKNITQKTSATALADSEFNLPQIRYDLKKTAIVVLFLTAIIVALYYLDLKYGILMNFGNWLFNYLNIH
ncbi:TPA: hypothetical protein DD449_05230 [Candidatus Berkelbacteria bacterium]|uniref:Uncharacterized protein n=1 Tax=Berkelbacteria bacterium GW2011_GWE1_39_12 TaxID=1618337 RepID=A0A0G4B4X9_9BACT|nr:MAG: hypothetical protein UT28_C0001G0664 [Berkelbacteria bacterium GW2011_GWE1_39_12]HBO61055.1 hypothetical protein [Candidatus Berkelbacteria bacterium]